MPSQRRRRERFQIAEFLGTHLQGGRFSFWVWGIVSAAMIALYGLTCMLAQSVTFIGRRPTRLIEYTGGAAIALGVIYVAVALFVHCHNCWSEHDKYCGYAEVGKLASIIVFVCGFGCFIYDIVFLQ